jgi:hypothetical protein
MQKPKATIIVEEVATNTYRVRRTKNWTEPLSEDFVVGRDIDRIRLDGLIVQGVDVIIDQVGYKRRWTP